MKTISKTESSVDWTGLLIEAVNVPGLIHDAYSAFRNFSLGNQLLAAQQMRSRGIQITPLATFKQWLDRGRAVKKGEKAISLYRPVSASKPKEPKEEDENKDRASSMFFVLKPHWFALSQTDGDPFEPEPFSGEWNHQAALSKLGIQLVPFDSINGGTMGWARPSYKEVSVSDLSPFPQKTLIHEIAHCLLHADGEVVEFVDGSDLSKNLKEVEAESVAYLVLSALGLKGGEFARGYIQAYLSASGHDEIPSANARRIMSCANKIIEAGMPAKKEGESA